MEGFPQAIHCAVDDATVETEQEAADGGNATDQDDEAGVLAAVGIDSAHGYTGHAFTSVVVGGESAQQVLVQQVFVGFLATAALFRFARLGGSGDQLRQRALTLLEGLAFARIETCVAFPAPTL